MNPISANHKKLKKKTVDFIKSASEKGVKANLVKDSFNTYSVKVSAEYKGKKLILTIYYSPGKNTFKYVPNNKKETELLNIIEDIWHGEGPGKGYHVFTDGSYIRGSVGFGAVILKDNKVIKEISGRIHKEKTGNMRQVSGEIEAVRRALSWCLRRGVREVTVHYDYKGVEKWATGRWRRKNPHTKEYASFIKNINVKINWHKEAAHSGERWNDRADKLAKEGTNKKDFSQGELYG